MGLRISEFRYILCFRATARCRGLKWMARPDSGCQLGLGRYSPGLFECSGGISGVEKLHAEGFRIPEFGDILGCSATTRGAMTKWMAQRDSAHRIGLVRYSQGLSDCCGGLSGVDKLHAGGFRIPEFLHVQACRATTKSVAIKWMAP